MGFMDQDYDEFKGFSFAGHNTPKSSPDSIYLRGSIPVAKYYDEDAWCFGYVHGTDLYSTSNKPDGSYHQEMSKALKQLAAGEIPTEDGDYNAGDDATLNVRVWRGPKLIYGDGLVDNKLIFTPEEVAAINKLNTRTPTGARLSYSICGRLWTARQVIAFWANQADVKSAGALTAPIEKEGLNPEDFRFVFADTGTPTWYQDLNGEQDTLSAEEQRELMQKQHLDPKAKKKLAAQPGVQKMDRSRGFQTPVQRKFATTFGDSLAQVLVKHLLD